MKKLFCDMDGVLVNQTGRDGFDTMPWMPDGKVLWDFIAPLRPTILSMLRCETYERCAPQKRAWCAHELGSDVEVIVVNDASGKSPHATPGAVLIDDGFARHSPDWVRAGGIFLHHTSARNSIEQLRKLIG